MWSPWNPTFASVINMPDLTGKFALTPRCLLHLFSMSYHTDITHACMPHSCSFTFCISMWAPNLSWFINRSVTSSSALDRLAPITYHLYRSNRREGHASTQSSASLILRPHVPRRSSPAWMSRWPIKSAYNFLFLEASLPTFRIASWIWLNLGIGKI